MFTCKCKLRVLAISCNYEPQGLAPARKKIDPGIYTYTREDTMAEPSSLRPPFFTLFSQNSSTHRDMSFN